MSRAFSVVVVALLVHGIGVLGGYTLDDGPALLRHPAVNESVPIWEVFTREFWGAPLGEVWSSSYRPITSLSFALEHRIGGGAAWLHHLSNLLIYLALCFSMTKLLLSTVRPNIALAVGLWFAVLPVHVENVASITGRADVLAAGFGLCALWCVSSPGKSRPWLAAIFYAVALGCKETVVLLPAISAWWVFLRQRSVRGTVQSVAPIAGVGLLYVWARVQVLPLGLPADFVPADNPLVLLDGLSRVWGALAVLGRYFELLLFPAQLCADHTYGDFIAPAGGFGPGSGPAWLGFALVLVGCWDGIRAWRGRSPGHWASALLAISLVSQFFMDTSVVLAERLLLWPTVFVALALADELERRLPTKPSRRSAIIFLSGLIALIFTAGLRSGLRTLDWRDRISLYRSSAEACPAAVHNRLNLAHALREAGDLEGALWHFALAGASRMAFPGPVPVEEFPAEGGALRDRLLALTLALELRDPSGFYLGLARYLEGSGAPDVAKVLLALRLVEGQP